ncbi:MAG TPA: NfeD family protein [Clostridia bacterium]|nr:NfeD family protein [Clostridia bacterium]
MNWLLLNPVYFWLVMGGIFLIVEGVTYALVTIWFVGGALVALLLAYLGVAFGFQFAAFIIVSFALLLITRPLVKRKSENITHTNVDAVLGQTGIVTKELSEHFSGQGKVGGQIWTIASLDGQCIDVGKEFVVLSVEGVTLVVEPLEEEVCSK